jgi:hypothetical protein
MIKHDLLLNQYSSTSVGLDIGKGTFIVKASIDGKTVSSGKMAVP